MALATSQYVLLEMFSLLFSSLFEIRVDPLHPKPSLFFCDLLFQVSFSLKVI